MEFSFAISGTQISFDFDWQRFVSYVVSIMSQGTKQQSDQADQNEEDEDDEADEDGYDPDYLLSRNRYAKDLQVDKDRYSAWLEAHGFERATKSLDEETLLARERYELKSGSYDVDEKLKEKSSNSLNFDHPKSDQSSTYSLGGKNSKNYDTPEWHKLYIFAKDRGFVVTSTLGDKHNAGSLHSKGRAIDVRTRDKSESEVRQLINSAKNNGIRVKDERAHPPGQKVWSAPHVHLSVPENAQSRRNIIQPSNNTQRGATDRPSEPGASLRLP